MTSGSRFGSCRKDRQDLAREAFRLWLKEPLHPSLHVKTIAGRNRLVSARIGRKWRVVGAQDRDLVIWFWVGPHHEYDKLLQARLAPKRIVAPIYLR